MHTHTRKHTHYIFCGYRYEPTEVKDIFTFWKYTPRNPSWNRSSLAIRCANTAVQRVQAGGNAPLTRIETKKQRDLHMLSKLSLPLKKTFPFWINIHNNHPKLVVLLNKSTQALKQGRKTLLSTILQQKQPQLPWNCDRSNSETLQLSPPYKK